jgi:hypothetical protein
MGPEAEVSTAGADGTSTRSPETVDRLMVGVCGAIWLVLLAAGVFATVAMVRLGSGHTSGGEGQSSWLLYSIIVVSALVIIAAVPLLMRARRAAQAVADQDEAPVESPVEPVNPTEAATEKMRVFGVDPYERVLPEARPLQVSEELVDRLLLRGTVSLLGAMGVALTAVTIGGYLLAERNDTGAWVALGLAAVVTVAMPAVAIFFQRQLGEAMEEAGE